MDNEPINTSLSEAETTKDEQEITLLQAGSIEHEALESATGDAEITREQLSLGRRLLNWRTLVPLLIVLALLIYSAQKLNINPAKTWAAIFAANLLLFLTAFLIYYLSFPLRALRWRLLLENAGFTPSNGIRLPGLPKLTEIVYISFFANGVVPAKLGDLYRAYLLRQDIGVSTARGFGTVLAERLLDLIVLLLLFVSAIIISLHANLPAQLRLALFVTLGLVIAGIIGLFLLRLLRRYIARIIPARLRSHYTNFQEGTLGSFQRLPLLAALTVGVWACEGLRFFFVALSLSLIGGNVLHILTAACFIALGEALLTIVPFTGGGVGLVEAGMFAMIALFAPTNQSLAAAAILLDRTISLLSVLAIGFVVFLIAFGRQTTKQSRRRENEQKTLTQ
ncbi:MAG TPA: lysylphosphatidylglycerol synthase transmembrane domain-containing protein [Ktedonobacteraceae bacterium]|nr:lysylphosphatidylglycerol synthase transmembrane domain-containing protein [Ktedonobacteraceae bacterium]